MTRGHVMLRDARASRPALLVAQRLGVPVRTVRRWLAGAVPRYAGRVVLERVLGIPVGAWEARADG